MENFEDFGFIPDERSPHEATVEDFLRLGISPEALSELSTDQARFVLGSLAKSLVTLTHPDHRGPDTILGLSIGEINYIGHRVQTIEDGDLSAALDHLRDMPSGGVQARKKLLEREQELERSLDISSLLAQELAAGPESIANTASISIMLPSAQGDVNVYRATEERVQIATVKNGIITESYEVEPVSDLVANLTDEQQAVLRSYRPEPDTPVVRVYIEGGVDAAGLETGWYLLKDAIHKESDERALGVKMYIPHGEHAEEMPEVVGSRLIGYYDYSSLRGGRPTRQRMLPIGSEVEADTINCELALSLYAAGYASDQETAYLMAREHIIPFTQADELQNQEHFVFRRSDAAYAKRNIITPPILARHPL